MISNQFTLDFEPDVESKNGQAFRTLALLESRPRTTLDLHSVGPRPAAYVRQLRVMGYRISTEKQDGIALYTLIGKVEMVEVTDELKAAYYTTPHWKEKRLERMRFDGFECKCCTAKSNLQVHHWCYDLFSESICDLLTVCDDCHTRIHSYENVHCHFPKSIEPWVYDRIKCA